MRFLLRNITLLVMLLIFFTVQISAAESKNETLYYEKYVEIVKTMEQGMESAPKTGDASLDFLYEMIPHHEGAVAMSENVLKYGSNKQVKLLASNIISEQLVGIRKMENLIDKIKVKPNYDKKLEGLYLHKYNKIYQVMITAMKNTRTSGNISKDFLQEMIPHHKGAIEMGQNIITYTQNAELKEIVSSIVANQKKQIVEMEELLNTIK